MGFWGVSNILLFTGLGIIGYFAFSSAKENDRTDMKEFFKLSGILISLAVLCVIFIDITFLIIQVVSWLVLYLFSVLKNDLVTLKNGYLLTLLLVNAGGAYMVWELRKERAEEEKFKEEAATDHQKEESIAAPEEETSEAVIPDEPAAEQTEPIDESEPEKDARKSDDRQTPVGTEGEAQEYAILKEIDISHRVAKTLHEAGIDTVKDLTENSIDQLKSMKNLGEKSLDEIENALEKAGLSLKAV